MKYLTIPLLLVTMYSCNDKHTTKIESKIIESQDSKKVGDSIEIGYYDSFEKLPKFNLEAASEDDFKKLKSATTFIKDKIENDKQNFYLQIAGKKVKFKNYETNSENDFDGSEYLGYNSTFDLFAVQNNTVSDNLGFADIDLINKTTGFKYKIISLSDWCGSVPLASPNNQFLVYFQDPEYESQNLSIVVLKVNDKNNPKTFLKEYASCFTENGFSIEEIRWRDDHNFVIKAYKSENNDNGKEVKYYSYFSAKID